MSEKLETFHCCASQRARISQFLCQKYQRSPRLLRTNVFVCGTNFFVYLIAGLSNSVELTVHLCIYCFENFLHTIDRQDFFFFLRVYSFSIFNAEAVPHSCMPNFFFEFFNFSIETLPKPI